MQRIEIHSAEVQVKEGVSKRTGRPYSIREQKAWLHTHGKQYPVECLLTLGDSQKPHEPGVYRFGTPFYVGSFNSLAVSRDLNLIPVKETKAA